MQNRDKSHSLIYMYTIDMGAYLPWTLWHPLGGCHSTWTNGGLMQFTLALKRYMVKIDNHFSIMSPSTSISTSNMEEMPYIFMQKKYKHKQVIDDVLVFGQGYWGTPRT